MGRIGCLSCLLLLLVLGAYVQYFGNAPPDRDEGPERLAWIAGFVLIVYLLVVGITDLARAIRRRREAKPPGLPIDPIPPRD